MLNTGQKYPTEYERSSAGCVEVSGFIFPPADLSKFFLLVCTFHILKQAQEHREALDGILFRTNVSSAGQNTAVEDSSTVLKGMLPLLLAGSPTAARTEFK